MHTLSWNRRTRRWVVSFVAEGRDCAIGSFERGQDAVDLVNCLNGGQPVVATDDGVGWLGTVPGPSDAEMMRQLSAESDETEEPSKAS